MTSAKPSTRRAPGEGTPERPLDLTTHELVSLPEMVFNEEIDRAIVHRLPRAQDRSAVRSAIPHEVRAIADRGSQNGSALAEQREIRTARLRLATLRRASIVTSRTFRSNVRPASRPVSTPSGKRPSSGIRHFRYRPELLVIDHRNLTASITIGWAPARRSGPRQ